MHLKERLCCSATETNAQTTCACFFVYEHGFTQSARKVQVRCDHECLSIARPRFTMDIRDADVQSTAQCIVEWSSVMWDPGIFFHWNCKSSTEAWMCQNRKPGQMGRGRAKWPRAPKPEVGFLLQRNWEYTHTHSLMGIHNHTKTHAIHGD